MTGNALISKRGLDVLASVYGRERVDDWIAALGWTVIPTATADALANALRRLDAGIPVPRSEARSILYAIAACSPDGQVPRVYA
jgi:hypothetical protein